MNSLMMFNSNGLFLFFFIFTDKNFPINKVSISKINHGKCIDADFSDTGNISFFATKQSFLCLLFSQKNSQVINIVIFKNI